MKQYSGNAWRDIGGTLVAHNVTAELINALNVTAKNLEVLSGENILLKAGNSKVDIAGFTVTSNGLEKGQSNTNNFVHLGTDRIELGNGEDEIGSFFYVDNMGKLSARNVAISGHMEATSGTIGGCSIVGGQLEIPAANITGELKVADATDKVLFSANTTTKEIEIAGFNVVNNALQSGTVDTGNFVHLSTDGIKLGQNFKVDPSGRMEASSGKIGGLTVGPSEV